MNFSSKKSGQGNALFDSVELNSDSEKSLNIFILSANELKSFEDVKIRDFSDLETFYNAIREAKERITNENIDMK